MRGRGELLAAGRRVVWVSAGHIPILFPRGLPVLPKLGNGEPHFSVPPVVQVWDVIDQNQIQLLGIWPMEWI